MSAPTPTPGQMTRVRIRVKAMVPGGLASWPDCEITLIAPDGSEMPMTNVQAIDFYAEPGPDAMTVTLRLVNPEIEFEGNAVIKEA